MATPMNPGQPRRRVVSTTNAGAPVIAGLPTFMRQPMTKPVAPKPIPPRPPVGGMPAVPAMPTAPGQVNRTPAPVAVPAVAAPAPVPAAPVMPPAQVPAVPADSGFNQPAPAENQLSPLERYLQILEQRRARMAENAVRTGQLTV
jgi:hypothetical protein